MTIKFILKFIKDNPKMSATMLAKQLGQSRAELRVLLDRYKIKDNRFTSPIMGAYKLKGKPSVSKLGKKKLINSLLNKVPVKVAPIKYDKISKIQLHDIMHKSNAVAAGFMNDINSLQVGDALQIKKENWTIKSKPHFYFQVLTRNTPVKVRVKTVDDSYYVIKL